MLKGFKTVAFNLAMGGIMLVRALNPDAELPGQEAVQSAVDNLDVALTSLWAVGNLVLRAVTSTHIFDKGEDK